MKHDRINTLYDAVLIGGASHTGKSTVAQALATCLGWSYHSTDKLARHPGRPWKAKDKNVPQHVAKHYLLLSPEALLESVLQHYRNTVWPLVESLVNPCTGTVLSKRFVLEGSAVLPELFATIENKNIAALYMTASNELLKKRIHRSSLYDTKLGDEKDMIDSFLERNCLFNEYINYTLRQLEQTVAQPKQTALFVKETHTAEDVLNQVLAIVAGQ